jgi:hypothetical protein
MERHWQVAKVRLIRLTALLLVSIAAGCASTPTEPESANLVQPHEVTIEEACGNPTRFPVSQECLNAMGYRYRPLLQQKSDLLMGVWRACFLDDPCTVIREGVGGTRVGAAPACQKAYALFDQMVTAFAAGERDKASPTPEFDSAERDCERAQHEDYSCRALQGDAVYQRQRANVGPENECTSKRCSKLWKKAEERHDYAEAALDCDRECEVAWNEPTDNDCQQAKAALADFQDRVQKAMLDAQLKAAFAPPEPIFFPPPPQPTVIIQPPQPPVIIQQQAAPLAPLPGPPVFTHCTNLGLTTNCITH